VSVSHGQGAGFLGAAHEPFTLDSAGDSLMAAVDAVHRQGENRAPRRPEAVLSGRAKRAFNLELENSSLRAAYGAHTFGQSCLLARRLVENGVRCVAVNMFDTVFNEVSWDCHADGGALAVTLADYARTLCPMFDQAYSALLEDLQQRGMLDNTLVVAMGEFGRTPRLNPRGGRDHWPNVWSVLFAGGGVVGGQIIGASDPHGTEPIDRPVHASAIAASVYHALGIDPQGTLASGSSSLVDAAPVRELFGS
jgi:hypothetical protein